MIKYNRGEIEIEGDAEDLLKETVVVLDEVSEVISKNHGDIQKEEVFGAIMETYRALQLHNSGMSDEDIREIMGIDNECETNT